MHSPIKIYIIEDGIKVVIDGIFISEDWQNVFMTDDKLSELIENNSIPYSNPTKNKIKSRIKKLVRLWFDYSFDDIVDFRDDDDNKRRNQNGRSRKKNKLDRRPEKKD